MRRARRVVSVLAAAGIATVSLIAAPTARAGQLESGTFEFPKDETFSDCGFAIHEVSVGYGNYSISKGTKKTGGEFFRVKQHIRFQGTFTNVKTDDYFTVDWHTYWREMPATIVDENGPIVTYQTKESGVWDSFRDSSGKVRYRSTGNLVFEYVFDTGGDGAPGGGEFLSADFVRTSGNWQTFDADFCDIAADLIG